MMRALLVVAIALLAACNQTALPAMASPPPAPANTPTLVAQTGPYTPQAVPDVTITGTINNGGSSVNLALNGQSTCSMAVNGTWSGALQPTGVSNDGVTQYPLQITPYGGGAPTTSITSNGLYIGACTALSQFSVIATSWTSGTAVIALRGAYQNTSAGASSTVTLSGQPISTTATVANFPATQTVSGAGSAGSPNANVVTVQGIGGGTNLNVNCAAGCVATGWTPYNVPASSACVSAVCNIKTGNGTLHAIIGLTTAGVAQPAGVCKWTDDAGSGTGPLIYQESGLGAGQVVVLDYKFTTGASVQCAANPGGGGINNLYL